ncbi:[citrate (pro-3S)-lyase] ligase [Utexia brackfieldae]|uniref:[citrate (pro-3S)-lyase] ligase n=1 Tax=Utexia brackfieldae TaxID=3074108 RepID=UPI00370DCC0E
MHETSISFNVISVTGHDTALMSIKALLATVNLDIDVHIHHFVVGLVDNKIVACAGIERNIIKCVAVHPDYQGLNVTLKLIETTMNVAYEQGQFHLFLYTKPENVDFFTRCGFYSLVEVPDTLVLMENTPVGISRYCQKLAEHRHAGRCGAIVMNANPFTRGHLYLVEQAAKAVNWLYLFVVSEDASLFPAHIRYQLVQEGVSQIANVTVLSGSEYIISKATFPTYFLKDQPLIEQTYMAVDLLLFRQYIAPALAISCRYVGTEPHSQLTDAYNQAMKYWLENQSASAAAAIEVIEIPRLTFSDDVISASRVRSLLTQQKYQDIEPLVPPSTWSYIKQHYHL